MEDSGIRPAGKAFSKAALFLGSLLLLCTTLWFPRWTKPATESTFGWDIGGYYWYLPATFIYHDLKHQAFADSIIHIYQTSPTFDHTIPSDNGGQIIKYSAGMAVMYSPAFFIAHGLVRLTPYPADGFSKPYQIAIQLWSTLVAMIGLWVLRRVLLRYYRDSIVAIVLILLTVGTNYLNYASVDGTFSHNYLFTLYSLLLLLTDRFYDRPSARTAAGIGCTIGLMILTRPTEASAALLPLLWRLDSITVQSIRGRVYFYLKQWKYLLLAGGTAAAIASLQVIYWKLIGGHWLIYSYGAQGFYWTRPHVWDYAMSYRSGWLVYTPLLFLGLAGIVPFLLRGKNRIAMLLFAVVSFYVVSAWDMWWYAGTGGRAMIQYYPVWMFFLASLLTAVSRRKVLAGITAVIIALFAYVNVWVTWQQHKGGLYDAEAMNRAYYWKVIGRWMDPLKWAKLKDSRYFFEKRVSSSELIYQHDLYRTGPGFDTTQQQQEGMMLKLDNTTDSEFIYTLAAPPLQKGEWLRATATFSCPQKEWTTWSMMQFIIRLKKSGKIKGESVCRVHRFLDDGVTRDISVDLRAETDRPDSVFIHFWYPSNRAKPILISNLRLYKIR